ncbi:PREDICTED: uncharacterized protein LOC109168380 [Ipomoea nil]|uniref:uncharacterized protein LOC109168380 n=1 Tax=Ipomoea nil TaxID=35883 RepID=UPI000901DD10|nr:PREDICTED: uncharacterized protein LOC109168380 [Ipomoea nil]XP_019172942.1 PREDICTED: uncharacterized protein LOC109168380 [Ipomoea nil]
MDLATENRIAAILLKEAAELRRQAEKDGALAYLHRPTVRGRPNSRFLTATVLGVQQANRAVEVNEMWRLRQKELEVDNRNKRRLENECRNKQILDNENKNKRRSENENSSTRSHKDVMESRIKAKRHSDVGSTSSASCPSKKRDIEDYYSREDGLRDAEVEEFLHSRAKRGRGTVGSRMDETGPYPCLDPEEKQLSGPDMGPRVEFKDHAIIGPEKPRWLNSSESSEDEIVSGDDKIKVSKKYHSRKDKSKSKSREKDKKRRDSKRHKSHK